MAKQRQEALSFRRDIRESQTAALRAAQDWGNLEKRAAVANQPLRFATHRKLRQRLYAAGFVAVSWGLLARIPFDWLFRIKGNGCGTCLPWWPVPEHQTSIGATKTEAVG